VALWLSKKKKNCWSDTADMSIGRAYCKTGISNNKLYVVGGVTKGPGGLTPLQSHT
jgi:N-acetylneuraminic acid mutarotase